MSVKHIILIKEVGHEDRCLIKTFISIPNFSRAFPSLINILLNKYLIGLPQFSAIFVLSYSTATKGDGEIFAKVLFKPCLWATIKELGNEKDLPGDPSISDQLHSSASASSPPPPLEAPANVKKSLGKHINIQRYECAY